MAKLALVFIAVVFLIHVCILSFCCKWISMWICHQNSLQLQPLKLARNVKKRQQPQTSLIRSRRELRTLSVNRMWRTWWINSTILVTKPRTWEWRFSAIFKMHWRLTKPPPPPPELICNFFTRLAWNKKYFQLGKQNLSFKSRSGFQGFKFDDKLILKWHFGDKTVARFCKKSGLNHRHQLSINPVRRDHSIEELSSDVIQLERNEKSLRMSMHVNYYLQTMNCKLATVSGVKICKSDRVTPVESLLNLLFFFWGHRV